MIKDLRLPDQTLSVMREKYKVERDKRLSAGKRQIQEVTGDLLSFLDDPFLPKASREPIIDEVEVACVGAGFAGLLVGARFKEAGFKHVRLIDTAGDVGGVWYWNRYPEAKCDVHSLIYLPLLEETGYIPSTRYAPAPEIAKHAQRIARHYELYKDALFHTGVVDITWEVSQAKWRLKTDRGDSMLARFVVLCNGMLSRVKLPDIPGITSFKGESFHTSRWDYTYTGGSPTNSNLENLNDKVVGFIGTGATGLQCVAPLGRSAKKLYVFQRTPSTIGQRNNGPIDPEVVRSFGPGWQKRLQENFTAINFGKAVGEDLLPDGWTDLFLDLYNSPTYAGLKGAELAAEKERVDFKKMELIRQRIDSIVEDPATAERLKPYYNYLCKRAGWHDEYLPTFNLPNVELVDTQGAGVERVDEDGIIANGKHYDLDCLIFGTGFETETGGRLRLGFNVVGRKGISLVEKWKGGLATLHGLVSAGFPNLFITPGINSQAVVTTNVVHMTEEYAAHFAFVARAILEQGKDVFDVAPEAEAAWVRTIIDRRIDKTAFLEACTPGRNNYEGNAKARPIQNTVFGGGPLEYFALLKSWRDSKNLPGLRLSTGHDERDDSAGAVYESAFTKPRVQRALRQTADFDGSEADV
jgi:cation diffusion facilitator CzcD-associated flavoprotein CzcO